ncbi:MAG: hypothetical protein LBC56_07575 [Oscillospiraceae bacterium]|jgi:hypothetical protein|nr:hypothetical protein [Oscillospiraceae bacterium]
MLKGAKKRVIEVLNTENEYFEKIIFFISTDKAAYDDGFLRKEASAYAERETAGMKGGRQRNNAEWLKKLRRRKISLEICKYLASACAGAVIAAALLFFSVLG